MVEPKIALITGGTRGLGLAIARRLAREGYCPILNYRENEEAAAAALAELRPLSPAARTVRADVGSAEGAARAVGAAQEAFGRLDLLVNNAGPFVPTSLAETALDDWETMLHGVLGSVFLVTRLAIPLMRAQGGGNIVTLGSLNAEMARGAPNTAVYNALKSAVVVLTKSVARSEGRHGIRANVVNPGMITAAGVDLATIQAQIPLQRLGRPEEVAAAVAWLASAEAAYVSGAVLNVHGGLWA